MESVKYHSQYPCVEYKDLSTVVMSSMFWGITPCHPLTINGLPGIASYKFISIFLRRFVLGNNAFNVMSIMSDNKTVHELTEWEGF
jgi:hypothetical protein